MAGLNEEILLDVLRSEIRIAERVLLASHGTDEIDSLLIRLERLYGYLIYISDNGLARNVVTEEVLETIRKFIHCVKEINDILNDMHQGSPFLGVPLMEQGVGRPRYDLPRDQLVCLLEIGFTCDKISKMLGISQRTVRRRMSDYGLSIRQMYSNITDPELKDLIIEAHLSFPNSGYRFIRGWLMQRGLRVQEQRIRVFMREIDPVGVTNRFFRSIHRRTYCVAGSQALWHLDGNHKLIKWRLVIHGAIDGFSRLVVYLKCSPNNLARTVMNQFVLAVQNYGLPLRIRCDKGVENYDVAMFMLTHPERVSRTNTVIVGKSVHNQRIERLWRDVFQGVSCTYYYLFNHLEHEGLLDPLNEVDLFCLHYVYLNVINHHLEQWTRSWNTHKMTSSGNQTPLQMWIEGTLINLGTHEVQNLMNYGIDWNGPVPTVAEENVSVPPTICPLPENSYRQLLEAIPNDPESSMQDGSYGINKYLHVKTFVYTNRQV